MRTIETAEDLRDGLAALVALDPRLTTIAIGAGPLPLRRMQPGFASLVSIIVSQQVSRASAEAIMGRLRHLVAPLEPAIIVAAPDETFRQAGFSRPKQRTVTAIAAALIDGSAALHDLADLPAQDAMARLRALPGIGPWSAEIYLLFCLGHPDIFPSGDIALQAAVADALGLPSRPSARDLARISETWSPWRGIAARLFWAHYRSIKGRDALVAA